MATNTLASSRVALQHAPHPVLRVLSYFLLAWSRLWRGTIFTGFVAPLLYLGAIGFGLGSLIDAPGSNPLGVPFLQFVAPGVLAATAMQIGAFEATYPVLGAIKWQRNYHAMLATPLTSDHIVLGHLAFIVVRCVVGAAVFLVVAALLGAVASPWAVVAVVAAGLIGLAHAAPMYLVATRTETDVPFTLGMRLVIMPLFLFSGTFFPVSLLPGWLQPVAWATPLWHGVELARAATLGRLEALPALGHVVYLVVVCVVFVQLSRRGLRRRLVT